MSKNEQNQNGESTPNAPTPGTPLPTPDPQPATAIIAYEFPRVQDVADQPVIKFGDKKEILRISETQTVEIDAFMFTGPKILKLKKIKPVLAAINKAGNRMADGKEYSVKWFDDEVRDPFHKVLRFINRQSMEHGKPVSVGFTRRTDKKTGSQVVTAKHGYEFEIKPPTPATVTESAVKALADQAKANEEKAKEQSSTRGRRQSKKNKPLTPVIAPENVNRIDALIAQTEADKANGATEPATEAVEQK